VYLAEAPTGAAGRQFDGVFEGGGAKGLAFVGALDFMEQHRLWFRRVAGTSAGAITASLVAAGYKVQRGTRGQLHDLVFNSNFDQFKDLIPASTYSDAEIQSSPLYALIDDIVRGVSTVALPAVLLPAAAKIRLVRELIGRVPAAAMVMGLLKRGGAWSGNAFRAWINEQISRQLRALAPRGAISASPTFGELFAITRISLSVVAADLRRKNWIIFNEQRFPNVSVADAVRASMSIPFAFVPARHGGCMLVDGGLLSNYPMWLFRTPNAYLTNTPADLARPTVGFLLEEMSDAEATRQACATTLPLIDLAGRVIDTLLEAQDRRATPDYRDRTVRINVATFDTMDFGMPLHRKMELANRGWQATAEFFRSRGVASSMPSPYVAQPVPIAPRPIVPSIPLPTPFGPPLPIQNLPIVGPLVQRLAR